MSRRALGGRKQGAGIIPLFSHDLRAPLRHIDGYAALLRQSVEPSLNDKAARYLQTIVDSAKQMGQLIDTLLVLSRMGRQVMLHATVNLDR
ncbi:MAG: histidine kinase dimerization/phospho-acceptor domain-containing protein [Nitrospira sp.]|nr:histidine kinase dimerization/phospho-acceptor domain-containing protein [Nitrospira sp.]